MSMGAILLHLRPSSLAAVFLEEGILVFRWGQATATGRLDIEIEILMRMRCC